MTMCGNSRENIPDMRQDPIINPEHLPSFGEKYRPETVRDPFGATDGAIGKVGGVVKACFCASGTHSLL